MIIVLVWPAFTVVLAVLREALAAPPPPPTASPPMFGCGTHSRGGGRAQKKPSQLKVPGDVNDRAVGRDAVGVGQAHAQAF